MPAAAVAVLPRYIPGACAHLQSLEEGPHGIRRATVINSDVVRSAEFVELRRTSAELKARRTSRCRCSTRTATREIGSWGEIATVIEQLGRKGLQIQRYKGLGEMNVSSARRRNRMCLEMPDDARRGTRRSRYSWRSSQMRLRRLARGRRRTCGRPR